MSPHLQLLQTPSDPVSNPSPVQVISWDPSRPWRGPAHQSAQLDDPLYLQGQLWGPHHLSLGVLGWGSQPAHQLVVRQAGQRLRLIRSFATKHPLAPSGLTCRPRLLPLPASESNSAEKAGQAADSSSVHEFFFFLFFFWWESYSLHIYVHATKETTSVKRKAIYSRSCSHAEKRATACRAVAPELGCHRGLVVI